MKLTYETGTLDTLYKVLLTEEVHYYKRSDDHKARRILYNSFEESVYRVSVELYLEGAGHRNEVGHCPRTVWTVEEESGIELVCPLPREGEEEDCNHHRHGERKDYPEESVDNAGSINICGFLKLIRNTLEELTKHKYVKSVLESESEE